MMDSSNDFKALVDNNEYKDTLLKMITKTAHFTDILSKSKEVFHTNVLSDFKDLIKTNNKGNIYLCNRCDYCHKKFSTGIDDETITAFRCGHKIHLKCIKRDKKTRAIYCVLCKQSEMESYDTESDLKKKRKNFLKVEDEDEFIGIHLGSRLDRIRKLVDFDNEINEVNKFLDGM